MWLCRWTEVDVARPVTGAVAPVADTWTRGWGLGVGGREAALISLSDDSIRVCLLDSVALIIHYRKKIPISVSQKQYFLPKVYERRQCPV